jgi:hypothetical protein
MIFWEPSRFSGGGVASALFQDSAKYNVVLDKTTRHLPISNTSGVF